MSNAEEAVRDQVEGILQNVFAADQSYSLAFCVGKHASALNAFRYGVAFRPIQDVLAQYFILSVTKLFEEPNKRYSTRSIPTAIRILQRAADEITIHQKLAMLSRFARGGGDAGSLQDLSDEQITTAIISHYERLLPSKETVTGFAHWRTLHALKVQRDKVIAHNENTADLLFPRVDWGEAAALIRLAKSFVDVIITGYLGYILTDDNGNFMTSSEAEQPAKSLDKFLTRLSASCSVVTKTESPTSLDR
jgi:hypothetical protein